MDDHQQSLRPGGGIPPTKRAKLDSNTSGSSNPPDDLIGDMLDSTDPSNVLGGFGLNSTAIPKSQQMQRHPMINPSTSIPSLRPTTVSMGSRGMVPHGVTHPQATMRPMCSTGWGYPRHGGGGGQYEMMPGQYVNLIPRPGAMWMAMGQQHTPPHMVTHQHSFNPAMGAGVQPFSKLSVTVPQSPLDPTLRTSSELGVSPQPQALPPSQQPLQTHTPPPLPQMSQTRPPHLRPQFFSLMSHTQSPSSLQPAATSSAPQNRTQSSNFKPHGPGAHLTSSSRQQEEPSSSRPLQVMGRGEKGWMGPQGVNSRPVIDPNQWEVSPSQYNLDTPTLPGGGNRNQEWHYHVSPDLPADIPAELAVQSRVLYPVPIPNIASRPTQLWHQHVNPDLRQHLVRKLCEPIYLVQDPMALQDRHVASLIEFAMKVEKAMFETATSRDEYYQLIAEKIYQIHKGVEERRKVKIEMERRMRMGDFPGVCLRQLQLPSDPTQWTEDQVYHWAEWTVQEFGLTSVNLSALRGISGHQLCSFTSQQFFQLGFKTTDAWYLKDFLDIIKAGASENKTLNTTSHDQDKKKLSSPPGTSVETGDVSQPPNNGQKSNEVVDHTQPHLNTTSQDQEKLLFPPGVDESVETEHARTSPSTSPKQQPFKTESMLLFEQAMKEGYIEVSIIKCLLLGTAGVGKTCLLHLLLGMLPPHLRQSTACIEQAIRAICMKYGIDSQGEWQKVDSDGLRDRLAGSVSCHQKDDDADVSPVPASDSSLPFDQEEEATDFTGPESYTMEDIVKLLEEEAQLGRLQDMTWVYLVDSGGQPQFHELLTAFFRNALIGIFVHKLSESLDDHPHVRYFDKEGKECGTGYRSPLSNRDLFQHCIQTVQSLPYTTEESTCPRLGVVGTFRDEEHLCKGESRNEKNKQLREILRPISDSVLFRTGMQEVIFPVNAISPNDEDKEIARKLRYKIESLKPPPEKLPLKWYGLELELEKEAAQRNRWVFTKEECLQVAKRLHFPSDEALDAALVHLDKLNIFLYYPSVLPELVFCSPCVLLDKISELVEESYRLKHGPDPNALVEGKFSGFCNKGLITAQLLEGYPKHYTEFFTQAHLLKLFESLLIVAPIDHDTYFMPSLLDVLKQSNFQRPSCSCQLVISFKGRYAPLGLFSSLVAFLLSDKTEPNPWVVFGDTSKLYRNHITFYLDSYPGSVVLIDSAAFFEVYLILDCTDLPELYKDTCRYVSCTIEMGLNEAIKARNFQNVRFHKAISCPCDERHHTLHPALLHTCSGTQFWKCTQRRGTCGKLDECLLVWVKNYTDNSGAGEETSCHAIKRNFSVAGGRSKDQAETSVTGKLDRNQAQNFNVDDTPLDEHSLRTILDSISTLSADWFKLGVALGLSYGTLKTIESNHRGDAHRCMTEMVIAWLQKKDNAQPSWQSLASALSSPSVGRIEIATMIAAEHPP